MTRIHRRTIQKDLNDLDNQDVVITHPEPDILECEVKWALGSITTDKGRKIGAGIGSKLGAKIGELFGPAGIVVGANVGAVVGGFVGATVGKFAGTKVGQAVVAAAKKVVSVAKETAKKAWEGVKSVGRAIFSSLRSLLPW